MLRGFCPSRPLHTAQRQAPTRPLLLSLLRTGGNSPPSPNISSCEPEPLGRWGRAGEGSAWSQLCPLPPPLPGLGTHLISRFTLDGCQFSSNQMVAPHGCGYVPSLWLPPRTMPDKVWGACTSPDVQTASGLGTRRPGSGPARPPLPLQVLLLPDLCFLTCRVRACDPVPMPARDLAEAGTVAQQASKSHSGQGRPLRP